MSFFDIHFAVPPSLVVDLAGAVPRSPSASAAVVPAPASRLVQRVLIPPSSPAAQQPMPPAASSRSKKKDPPASSAKSEKAVKKRKAG